MTISAEQIYLYFSIQYTARNKIQSLQKNTQTKKSTSTIPTTPLRFIMSFMTHHALYDSMRSRTSMYQVNQTPSQGHNESRETKLISPVESIYGDEYFDSNTILKNCISSNMDFDIKHINTSVLSSIVSADNTNMSNIILSINARYDIDLICAIIKMLNENNFEDVCSDNLCGETSRSLTVALMFTRLYKKQKIQTQKGNHIARAMGLYMFDHLAQNPKAKNKDAIQSLHTALARDFPNEYETTGQYADCDTKMQTILRNTKESVAHCEPLAIT